MQFLSIIGTGLFLFLLGCSSQNTLQSFKESGESCQTTIEGTVTETQKWLGDAPLLVTRGVGRNFDFREGEILEYNEEGVMFHEVRRSVANNPDPKFYPTSQIFSLIDENGNILTGEYPDEDYGTNYFMLSIQKIGSDEKASGILIQPGKPFSYCAEPGEYVLNSIIWARNNGDSDITSDYVEFSNVFTIHENSANYIGDIYVNLDEKMEFANRYRYPMKELSRPDRTAGWVVGFGLTGAIINEFARDRGVVSILDFQIMNNLDYESSAGLPVRFTELY